MQSSLCALTANDSREMPMSFDIGVLGSGNLTRKNAVALILDACTNQSEVRVFVSAQQFTDAARFAADLAEGNEGYSLHVYDNGTASDFDANEFPTAVVHSSDNTTLSIGKAAKQVLYAYDEAEPAGQEAELTTVLKAGAKVLDLCGGLFELTLGEDAEPDEAQQPTAPPAATPPALKAVPEPAQETVPLHAVSTDTLDNVLAVQAAWDAYTGAATPLRQATTLVALGEAIERLREVEVRVTA